MCRYFSLQKCPAEYDYSAAVVCLQAGLRVSGPALASSAGWTAASASVLLFFFFFSSAGLKPDGIKNDGRSACGSG